MHDGRLVDEQLLTDVDGLGVAGGAAHEELPRLECEEHTVESHAGSGLILQPIGVVDGTGASKVIPIELQVTWPTMSRTPELCAVLESNTIQIIGQHLHLLRALEAHA